MHVHSLRTLTGTLRRFWFKCLMNNKIEMWIFTYAIEMWINAVTEKRIIYEKWILNA